MSAGPGFVRVLRHGPVSTLKIYRAGFRILKFFLWFPGQVPGFILKFSGFREPGPRPSLTRGQHSGLKSRQSRPNPNPDLEIQDWDRD